VIPVRFVVRSVVRLVVLSVARFVIRKQPPPSAYSAKKFEKIAE
jgi:hypothetical protein